MTVWRRLRSISTPTLLVCLLMLAYALFFSAYSLQRHEALHSYAADLSFIDQPMWNTLHSRFLERTLDDRQVSRVAEHLEPIIVPIALVYLVWDDVRAILIIQSVALALGALPVYWIARQAFGGGPGCADRAAGASAKPAASPQRGGTSDLPRQLWNPEALALAFAGVYLLFPALEAANLADFHADPFVVAPLLFAFWYANQRRYRAMWIWAAVAMLVKETLPLLTLMLGAYLVLLPGRGPEGAPAGSREAEARRLSRRHGLALMVASLGWFCVATFLIVAPLARQVYGTPGPIYLASRYATPGEDWLGWLGGLLATLVQPERLRYLGGLLAAVGWLPLLAPEYLGLGLPVLTANYLSNFAGQYSGQQHYSAPLAPAFVVAAIFGARRLMGLRAWGRLPRGIRRVVPAGIAAWVLAWSLGSQYRQGWTPLAGDFAWPRTNAHQELLARFARQIPPEAPLSTTPPLHPHLAHRQKIYLFPTVADADYVLLDVAGPTDAHPNDVRAAFDGLVGSGEFGVVDAADGYVLLARGRAGQALLPDAFYDFARAQGARPEYPAAVEFRESAAGPPLLRLVGYDVVDDPSLQQTSLRFYWQVLAPLPADTWVWPFTFADDGAVIEDTSQRPMVAPAWYPPAQWQPGETVVTETLPWPLGPAFNVGVAVLHSRPPEAAAAFADPLCRWEVSSPAPDAAPALRNRWAPLGRFARQGRYLVPAASEPTPAVEPVSFADGIQLTGYRFQVSDGSLSVVLQWQPAQPVGRAYTVFVHLVAADGRRAAQSDAQPSWVVSWPTDRWVPGQPVLDGHRMALPPDLAAGAYQVRVGLYDWQTSQRLPLLDGSGRPGADYLNLGEVRLP